MKENQNYILDLGDVKIVAEVKLNGTSVGIDWMPPYELDIIDFLKAGENQLEIEITNQWSNKLIEDRKVEPIDENKYPVDLMEVKRKDGKFQVHWLKPKSYDNSVDGNYVIRWETMGKRRYYKAPENPVEPSVLKLYRIDK